MWGETVSRENSPKLLLTDLPIVFRALQSSGLKKGMEGPWLKPISAFHVKPLY
jgi:hypothetical protein